MSGSAPGVRERLRHVPQATGVYVWKDAEGSVLYVGKAKNLRARMRSYFTDKHADRPWIAVMMDVVADFEYYVTGSEVESLVLEANLIKQWRPPYNVWYRDDKSYPFIALTTSDPFPAIKLTREKRRKGTRYFGPYTDAAAARATIEAVRRVWPICRASCAEWRRLTRQGGEPVGKPCFDHHIGKGPGACVGAVTREEYAETVDRVIRFLEGRHRGLLEDLEEEMEEAAAMLEYERAARLRNAIEAVRRVQERQKVVSERPLDLDVIGLFREETISAVHLFLVREGRVLAGNEFVLDKGEETPAPDLLAGFLLAYYADAPHVPKELVLPVVPADGDALAEWLSQLRGSKVRMTVPQRGRKRELLDLAARNAEHTLARYRHKTRYDEERLNRALVELESALALSRPPLRIECFDISTIHGRFSVGSMVVFEGGRKAPAAYRRFKVRLDTAEANDYAMMREVLSRRFARLRAGDARFGRDPDLIVVDGGRPQLSAALAAMGELGLDLPVVALAKREEELFVPGWEAPVVLPAGSASLYLVKRIRDEAHRFAIEYHRRLRGQALRSSILDEIPGVGPKRKKALLKHFGSVRRLRDADAEEIAAVPGVPPDLAEDIVAFLQSARP
ncbi:MAG: excinuclease ABC subunit UvrC [Coriobacteriia bacterium]